MPFKSDKQRRFMYAKHPEMAKRWEKHTPKEKQVKKTSAKQAAYAIGLKSGTMKCAAAHGLSKEAYGRLLSKMYGAVVKKPADWISKGLGKMQSKKMPPKSVPAPTQPPPSAPVPTEIKNPVSVADMKHNQEIRQQLRKRKAPGYRTS